MILLLDRLFGIQMCTETVHLSNIRLINSHANVTIIIWGKEM